MRRTLIASLIFAASVSSSAIAQDSNVTNLRVDKLEKEMRAVQRKVFGGTGAAIEPEIGNGTTAAGNGSAGPMADLTARVDALENQLKALTGQVEQDQNRIKKLEDAVKAMKADHDARLRKLEGVDAPSEPTPTVTPPTPKPATTVTPVAQTTPKSAPTPIVVRKPIEAPKTAAVAKPTTAKIDPARKGLLSKVELPDTGNAAEDAYAYGFRLWEAKLYPEAQVKLKEFSAKYPTHKRASFAQNLLGRAYLDEGKPALASVAFYENYTKNPRGERAPDSLYYLGVSLTKLKKLTDACKVYDEFKDVYSATAATNLKSMVEKGRSDAKCTA